VICFGAASLCHADEIIASSSPYSGSSCSPAPSADEAAPPSRSHGGGRTTLRLGTAFYGCVQKFTNYKYPPPHLTFVLFTLYCAVRLPRVLGGKRTNTVLRSPPAIGAPSIRRPATSSRWLPGRGVLDASGHTSLHRPVSSRGGCRLRRACRVLMNDDGTVDARPERDLLAGAKLKQSRSPSHRLPQRATSWSSVCEIPCKSKDRHSCGLRTRDTSPASSLWPRLLPIGDGKNLLAALLASRRHPSRLFWAAEIRSTPRCSASSRKDRGFIVFLRAGAAGVTHACHRNRLDRSEVARPASGVEFWLGAQILKA